MPSAPSGLRLICVSTASHHSDSSEEQINPNLSFSFLALFHTNNDYAPRGGSDKRAKGARAMGWCEAMSTFCCAIREVTSVP